MISAGFSPDGLLLGSGVYDKKLRLWQTVNGTLLHALDVQGVLVGCDGISAELLKEGGSATVESLHYLCWMACIAADVPVDWLRGVVVPLHKDGDWRAPQNSRPITLLSLVGKVGVIDLVGVLMPRYKRGFLFPPAHFALPIYQKL